MATAAQSKAKGGFGGRTVAVLAWAVAVWTTYEFIGVLITPEGAATPDWALFGAVITQAIMTAGESPLWRGKGRWYHIVVLSLDTATNVGGMFFYITRLDSTDSWRAFNQGLGMSGGLSDLGALLISIVVGILLAATPEFLWRQD